MTCVLCKHGQTRPERVTLERHNAAGEPIAVIHNFPAQVCEHCGEEYYEAADLQRVDRLLAETPVRIAAVPVYELHGA